MVSQLRAISLFSVWLMIATLAAPAVPAAVPAAANDPAPPALTTAQRPLAELLRPDGTLDLNNGFRGSLDPSGWDLSDEPDAAPRFVPSAAPADPGDEYWAAGFHVPGMNGAVNALALDGTGNLYAGGYFTTVDGVISANHIARWDGATWAPLGSGLEGCTACVYALAVDGAGHLYASGDFTIAGGVSAYRIARWDGAAWSPLGSGMNGIVAALILDENGNLYAGGNFTIAGDISARSVAQWNGAYWSPLGSGVNLMVYALAVDGFGNLYAGGKFSAAGGVPADNIARWDGTAWSALGTGMHGSYGAVLTLAVNEAGDLYAAGMFTYAGGVAANSIARWDGAAWSALGSGMNGWVRALAVDGAGNLYAGGDFSMAGGASARRIARWDGAAWSALGSGIGGFGPYGIGALVVDNAGHLKAGGLFTMDGGAAASYNSVGQWDGAYWTELTHGGNGMSGPVYALADENTNRLYAGGHFRNAGVVNANHVARWEGDRWSAVNMDNPYAEVYAIATDGIGRLYAGGDFNTAGGVSVSYIARWDGTAWSPMGAGMNAAVLALAVDEAGNVYAGGRFTTAGGVSAKYVARWDGVTWSALGSGMAGCSTPKPCVVTALVTDGMGGLYAGGYFTTAGGVSASSIAHWNGAAWSALGSGISQDG